MARMDTETEVSVSSGVRVEIDMSIWRRDFRVFDGEMIHLVRHVIDVLDEKETEYFIDIEGGEWVKGVDGAYHCGDRAFRWDEK